jgi:5S rRNA maturation endonuclease (ribonuclease M5)
VLAPVRVVHSGVRLADVAATLGASCRRVVILTDWDAAGGRLARRLRDLLGDGRLDVDLEVRRELARALRGEVAHVEGLRTWVGHRLEAQGRTIDEWLAETA